MGKKVIVPPTQVIPTADLRTHCRLGSDGSQDELIVSYLSAAHAIAEHYLGRPLGSQTLELALDAFPDGAIDLGGGVTSVTSVTYLDSAGALQTLDSANYTLDDYTAKCWLVLAYGSTWPATREVANAVKVRFVAGDLPYAAKAALLLMVGWLYENRGDKMSEDDIQPPASKSLLKTAKLWGFA